MRNKILSGETITITAGGTITSGQAVLVGSVLGVAVESAVSGESVAVQLEGVFTLPILGTDTPAVGAKLYWDAGNSRLTTTVGSNTEAGIAFAAKATGITTVRIKLKGR